MELWAFDVDGCLIDSLSGRSLRPFAQELLEALAIDGHTLVLWSAGGADYARERARTHGIEHHFKAFHGKERRDAQGRYVPPFAVDTVCVFVDDRPEDMPVGAIVHAVSPYLSDNPHDRALCRLHPSLA